MPSPARVQPLCPLFTACKTVHPLFTADHRRLHISPPNGSIFSAFPISFQKCFVLDGSPRFGTAIRYGRHSPPPLPCTRSSDRSLPQYYDRKFVIVENGDVQNAENTQIRVLVSCFYFCLVCSRVCEERERISVFSISGAKV
ncbi:hypothetical protein BDZ45DRAFT_368840 [Acephala macrosclerotiorum]|nr:hypothetical protein BDZ45DRAFT_368840 [Acephala macrosclerotiorum]